MNAAMEQRLALFIQNRDVIKRALPWENAMTHALCAMLDTIRDRGSDPDGIKRAKRELKKQTGAFSPLRGYPLPPLCTLATQRADAEGFLAEVTQTYRSYRNAGFPSSYYVAIAAFTALSLPDPIEPADAFALYRELRRTHSFLASQEDAISAVLLLSLGQRDSARCEEIYAIVQPGIGQRFGCWQLSKCLAMSDEPASAVADRAVALYEALKERGIRTGKGRELTALAMPVISGGDIEAAADRIAAVDAFLAGNRGFSGWSMTKPLRTMFSSSLASLPLPDAQDTSMQAATVTVTVTAALIAATTAAIAAAASASAAASSSG